MNYILGINQGEIMHNKMHYKYVAHKRNSMCATIMSLFTSLGVIMTATLSFRTTQEFVLQTHSFADMLGLKNSDYVREAVREKNERVMAERLANLSRKLSAKHAEFNESIEGSLGDGIA
ncbi:MULTISPECIES: antitoxin of toxin-antitoxin stability system [unclassified Undibacterium]|uniref:antitoxin of toxin-antitoxin stability system n=1 Tax=unclassified Undibacterium TaxID=2630295 RepID=UPI0033976BDA